MGLRVVITGHRQCRKLTELQAAFFIPDTALVPGPGY